MMTIREVSSNFTSLLGSKVDIRGRISSVRRMKRSVFADLVLAGCKIQCRFSPDFHYSPVCGDLIEVSGTCFNTSQREPTIDVSEISVIAQWKGAVDYKKVAEGKVGPLQVFLLETYEAIRFSQAVRNHIRRFLVSRDYMEVQTPVLGRNYNGGRSFPVSSSYMNHRIGFNRTTMEDRMQALIAAGYEKIFQIGSIFRSERENTFLEGYAAFVSFEDGKQLLKDLLSHTVKKMVEEGIGEVNALVEKIASGEWLEMDFTEGSVAELGLEKRAIVEAGPELAKLLLEKGIVKKDDLTLETMADEVANAIAQKQRLPTIVNGFPIWSSPLYTSFKDGFRLQRSRMYLPGQKGGFEIGVQENDYEGFMERMAKQRESWGLPENDDRTGESDLAKVISGGLPPIFGFALSPDRIVRIWHKECTIDPYLE